MYEAQQIKSALTMKQVAEFYGFVVNRQNLAVCPFHNDSKPSLHIYDGQRGFHCFACGAGGDVIDFVSKLYNLKFRAALAKLNSDFNLGLNLAGGGKTDSRAILAYKAKQRLKQAKIDRRSKELDRLAAADRQAHKFKKAFMPNSTAADFNDNFVKAVNAINQIELEWQRWW